MNKPEKSIDPKVINLSNRSMTESEIKLLSKGLKFTPTPNKNQQQLKSDIKCYTRKLRLTEYFHNSDLNENEPESLVSNKSCFTPSSGRNRTIDCVCNTLENLNLTGITDNHGTTRPKINGMEQCTLKAFLSDQNIAIWEAGKGGAVVIMSKQYYQQNILKML